MYSGEVGGLLDPYLQVFIKNTSCRFQICQNYLF